MNTEADEKLEFVTNLTSGYGLWRRLEAHGGYSWWTNDTGLPRCIWDEGLDDPNMLAEVLLIAKPDMETQMVSVPWLNQLRDEYLTLGADNTRLTKTVDETLELVAEAVRGLHIASLDMDDLREAVQAQVYQTTSDDVLQIRNIRLARLKERIAMVDQIGKVLTNYKPKLPEKKA